MEALAGEDEERQKSVASSQNLEEEEEKRKAGNKMGFSDKTPSKTLMLLLKEISKLLESYMRSVFDSELRTTVS